MMKNKPLFKTGYLISIFITVLWVTQARADIVSELGKIFRLLTEMRKDEIQPMKKSETERDENIATIEKNKKTEEMNSQDVDNLIENTKKNIKELKTNIENQSTKISDLQNSLQNADGSLKTQQLNVSLQSQTAMVINTSNEISHLQLNTYTLAKEIQNNLKKNNRNMYTRALTPHQVSFDNQFALGQ